MVPVDQVDVRAGQQVVRSSDLVAVGFSVVVGAGVDRDDFKVRPVSGRRALGPLARGSCRENRRSRTSSRLTAICGFCGFCGPRMNLPGRGRGPTAGGCGPRPGSDSDEAVVVEQGEGGVEVGDLAEP